MTERLKLCHVIDSSSRNPLLFSSVAHSDRSRIEYEVISLRERGGLHEQMDSIDVATSALNVSSRKQYAAAIASLVKKFRHERYDIVQVHSFEASLVGLIAAATARVPVRIFSGHHSHEVPLYRNPKLLFVDSFLSRRLATHVLSPSENMKDIFVESQRVPSARIKVIPHGVDLAAWTAAAAEPNDLRKTFGLEGKIIFGAAGRLFWVKGFDLLIESFADIASSREDVVLVIAGEGSERGKLESIIRDRGIEENIKLIGARSDIASVMSSFDVLIHPSLAESFGLIYVEAMALEKPVIATPFGIAPEAIQSGVNGYIAEPQVISLRDAMKRVLAEKDRWPQVGEEARKTAERYSVTITQTACDEYYESLRRR